MAVQVPTSFRLEVAPAASCTLRWGSSLYGFLASGSRPVMRSLYGFEAVSSAAVRVISAQPLPGDDLQLLTFVIEPLSGSVSFNLQLGEINPANPGGASLSTKTLDIVTVPLGSCLQLDAGAGTWRIVTKTTSYPLV